MTAVGSHLHLVALIVRDYGAASRPPVLTMRWWRLVSDQASIRVARQRRLKTDWNVVADDGSVVPRLRRCRRRSGRVVIYGTQIAGVHRVALPITGSFATEWVLDLKPAND